MKFLSKLFLILFYSISLLVQSQTESNPYHEKVGERIIENIKENADALEFINQKINPRDSTFYFASTYYVNSKGFIVNELYDSNLKSNQELHLLVKSHVTREHNKIKDDYKDQFNQQHIIKIKISLKENTLSYETDPNLEMDFSDNKIITVPVFKGCYEITNLSPKENFEAQKKCLEYNINKIITKKFKGSVYLKTKKRFEKKYKIRNQKITTIVCFRINKYGQSKVLYSLGFSDGFSDEAERIINNFPDCKPATENGKDKSIIYYLPVAIRTN